MLVEIWSDVVCPWCYIGKRRFDAALARFVHRDEVEVVWRSFELDPSAPRRREGDYAVRLAEKYGVPVARAQQMIDGMTEAAAGDGLTFRFDRAKPGNTFDAHRLLHLAADRGVGDALGERLFAAYLTDGEAIGEPDVLLRLGAESGLDEADVRRVLDGDAYADAVRRDEAHAAAIGATGVPFFVVDGRYAVSGAQPAELLLEVLERAWAQRREVVLVGPEAGGHGDGCEGDACAV